jgi:putative membrane protein
MPFLETLAQFNCTPFSHGGFGFSSGFGGHGVWLGGMHFPFGWIGIALLIGAAIWIASRGRRPVAQEVRTASSALDVLQRRYAAGDIDREEYLRRRTDLTN